MGVSFYSCNYCGKTFPDYGRYTRCNDDCCLHWCSEACAMKEGWNPEGNYDYDAGGYYPSCKYCRNEDADDAVLLMYALELLKMDRKQLFEAINADK